MVLVWDLERIFLVRAFEKWNKHHESPMILFRPRRCYSGTASYNAVRPGCIPTWSRVASVTRGSQGLWEIWDTSGAHVDLGIDLCITIGNFAEMAVCQDGKFPLTSFSQHDLKYILTIMKKTQLHHEKNNMNIKNRQVFERNKTPSWQKFPQTKTFHRTDQAAWSCLTFAILALIISTVLTLSMGQKWSTVYRGHCENCPGSNK